MSSQEHAIGADAVDQIKEHPTATLPVYAGSQWGRIKSKHHEIKERAQGHGKWGMCLPEAMREKLEMGR